MIDAGGTRQNMLDGSQNFNQPDMVITRPGTSPVKSKTARMLPRTAPSSHKID